MKSSVATFALALSSLTFALAQTLTINTPGSVTQCEPVLLSWTETTAPYYVYVLPGSTLINPYEQLSPVDTTSVTWTCDLGTSTTVTFAVKDGTGATQYTAQLSVGSSTNSTCIGTNAVIQASIAAASSASVASAGTTSAVSSTSASASSSGSSQASAGASASTAAASASASASATHTSGANALFTLSHAAMGIVGLAVGSSFFI